MADIYVSNEGLPAGQADGASWETAFEDMHDTGNYDRYYISGYHVGGFSLSDKTRGVYGYNAIFDGEDIADISTYLREINDEFEELILKRINNLTFKDRSSLGIITKNLFYSVSNLVSEQKMNFKINNLINVISADIAGGALIEKNTFIGSGVNLNTDCKNNIYYNCILSVSIDPTGIDYLYFLQTEIQFTGNNNADVNSIPRFLTKSEAVNAGVDEYLYSLEGKVETEWGSTVASNCFQNSIVDDYQNVAHSDIFVDLYNFNLNLVPGSSPVGAADDGGNMGANPTGGVHFAFPTDFDSYNNLDSGGNVLDPSQPATATSKVKAVNGGTPAIIKQINISGFENFSAGNLIDALPGLASTAITAGGTLIEGQKYHNSASGEDITLSGSSRTVLAGENFITASGETSFADSGGTAEVYNIVTERNGRNIKSVKMKVSDVYTTESEFASLPAYKFEYGTDVKANIDLLDNIQAGNADPAYDTGFPSDVYRAYMQLIVEFSPENIPQ